ncbi:protein ripply2.1-like [Bombina bombina]|uniref:protein ripply2.1-like n=1 Tax=Bombina bombina TaxID=8345 RepID=UPI00235B2C79|nr:protein ripply2.1-like [Bombina bombina]
MELSHTTNQRSCEAASANTDSNAGTASSSEGMWRPWCGTSQSQQSTEEGQTFPENQGQFKDKHTLLAYQHPVKLFWPSSKCYDFLYQDAEDLLRNFPVQATISFYQETDSDSDSEEDDISN